MDDFLKIILTTSSVMTAIGGGIAYFIKRNFEVVMDRKLKEQNMLFEKEMNIFNKQLENRSKEQFLVFESLHQERAELIKNLFKSLISIERSFEGLVVAEMTTNEGPGQPMKEDEETIHKWTMEYQEKIVKMMTIHEENRYYLSESLSSKFEEFVKKLAIINEEHQQLKISGSENTPEDFHQKLNDLLRHSKDLFIPIIKDIENEFRVIIGVKKEATTSL